MELSEVVRVQCGIEDSGSVRFVDSRTRRRMYVVECKDLWPGEEFRDYSWGRNKMHAYDSIIVSSEACPSTSCTSDWRSHTTLPYQSTQDPHGVPLLSLCLSS